MAFQPRVNQKLTIDGVAYSISEHPFARGMPYGQEGRAATVYQLKAGDVKRAFKVFKPRFRLPWLVSLTEQLVEFADLPGMKVCSRSVLTGLRHTALVREYPDLNYAVLMPWIEGPTWMEVLLDGREMLPEQSLYLARSFAHILASMEENRVAHCDLSGPNVLLPGLVEGFDASSESLAIELVDVEQMYGPGLDRPEFVPGGSPGYAAHRAHRTMPQGLWEPRADRFAGAVLLVEMLAWCDERIRQASWGESYFEPLEMQQEGERYSLMMQVLAERWGSGVERLFDRVWRSETLADCATFSEWFVNIPAQVPVPSPAPSTPAVVAQAGPEQSAPHLSGATASTGADVQSLMARAREQEARGDLAEALENYLQAAGSAPSGSALQQELTLIVEGVRAQLSVRMARESHPAPVQDSTPLGDPAPLMVIAREQEARGDVAGALESYQQAAALAPRGSGLQQELQLIVEGVRAQLQAGATEVAHAPTPQQPSQVDVLRVVDRAREQEARGDLPAALESYRRAIELAPEDTGLRQELTLIASQLQAQLESKAAAPAQPATTPPTVDASKAASTPSDATPGEPATKGPTGQTVTQQVVASGPVRPETSAHPSKPVASYPPPPPINTSKAAVTSTPAPSTASAPQVAASTSATTAVPAPVSRPQKAAATRQKQKGFPKWIIPVVLGVMLLVFGGIAVAVLQFQAAAGASVGATATAVAVANAASTEVASRAASETAEAKATLAIVQGGTATAVAIEAGTAAQTATAERAVSRAATASARTATAEIARAALATARAQTAVARTAEAQLARTATVQAQLTALPNAREINLRLNPTGGSGQPGTITLKKEGSATGIGISIPSRPASPRPAQLLKGSCASLSREVLVELDDVVDGNSQTVLSNIPSPYELLRLAKEQGGFAIAVQASKATDAAVIFCADVTETNVISVTAGVDSDPLSQHYEPVRLLAGLGAD